jgi:hypothetical protein
MDTVMQTFDSLEALFAARAADPDLAEEVRARHVSIGDDIVYEEPGPHAGPTATECLNALVFLTSGGGICETCGKRLQFRVPLVAGEETGAWFPVDWPDAKVFGWFRSHANRTGNSVDDE